MWTELDKVSNKTWEEFTNYKNNLQFELFSKICQLEKLMLAMQF